MNKSLFFLLGTYIIIASVQSKVYEPCELADELIKIYKFPAQDIANWICLVKWESNFDTSAIGRLNAGGSLDHGIFQISDKYWCANGHVDGACGLNCEDLQNENISDDTICAKRIFRVTKHRTNNGFDAWAGWKQHCQYNDVQSYVKNCTLLIK